MREDPVRIRCNNQYLAGPVYPCLVISDPNCANRTLTALLLLPVGIKFSSTRQTFLSNTRKVDHGQHVHAWVIGDVQPEPPSTSPHPMNTGFALMNEVDHGAALPSITYNHGSGLRAWARGNCNPLRAPPGIQAFLVDVPRQSFLVADGLECHPLQDVSTDAEQGTGIAGAPSCILTALFMTSSSKRICRSCLLGTQTS